MAYVSYSPHPVFSAPAGLGAPILSLANAVAYNVAAAAGRKSVQPWGIKANYNGPGDPVLAQDVYCYQHAYEGCGGACQPNVSVTDCYNRDGMIGIRTLQAMANSINGWLQAGQPAGRKWGPKWYAAITFPPGMVGAAEAQEPLPPASDVRPDALPEPPSPPPGTEDSVPPKRLPPYDGGYVPGVPDADIIPGVKKAGISPLLLVVGLVAVGGFLYFSQTQPKSRKRP